LEKEDPQPIFRETNGQLNTFWAVVITIFSEISKNLIKSVQNHLLMASIDWQEKYMQFQMLQQQMEKINEHLEMLQQRQADLEISRNAVAEIAKTAVGNEILVPVADGIFLKAKLLDNKKMIINVGADTTVEHPVDHVVGLLEKQEEEMVERITEVEEVQAQLQSQVAALYQEISKNEEKEMAGSAK